jgi:WD40 repeat protein
LGRSVVLWDLVDPDQPRDLGLPFAHTNAENFIQSLAFSDDGHLLATGGTDGTVSLSDITGSSPDDQSWQPARVGEPFKVDASVVGALAFAPDGATLATASFNTIILWNLADPRQPQRIEDPLPGHTTGVSFLTFTGDDSTLFTASYDNQVIIWDVADAQREHRIGQPLTGHSGGVMGVAVAPGGHTLATAGEDSSTVVLWDLTNPAQPRQLAEPLSGHRGKVNSIAFSADGQTLATGSSDGTTLLWDLGTLNQARDHATERACLIAGGSLGPEEWSLYISGLDYIETCRL